MKKIFIIALSLMVAATLALSAVPSEMVNTPQDVTLCDLDFERVCY